MIKMDCNELGVTSNDRVYKHTALQRDRVVLTATIH